MGCLIFLGSPIGKMLIFITFFTVFQALLSTFIAAFFGLSAAFFTANRNFLARKFFLSFSVIPLCMPSLIVALGYVSVFGMNGYLNKILMSILTLEKPPLTFLYTTIGIVLAQGFYNFPLVMKIVSDAWENLPSEQEDAAKLLGASSSRIFRTITFFKLLPALVSACVPIFIFCFFSFMIILIFGGLGCTTLEVELYKVVNTSFNLSYGLRIAFIETFSALTIIFIYTLFEQKGSHLKGISFNEQKKSRKNISLKKERAFALTLLLFVTVFFILPLMGILLNAFSSRTSSFLTVKTFISIFKGRSFFKAISQTFLTAFITGALCGTAGFLYASFLYLYKRKSNAKTIFSIIPIIPMAISSIVTGFIIRIFITQGNLLTLSFTQTVLMWPLAFRQIYAAIKKIPSDTVDSSLLLGGEKKDTVIKIFLPQTKKSVLSGALCCFAMSAGDSTLPLVLSIPKVETLALYTYRLAGRYRFNESCASGFILALLCIIIFTVARKIGLKEAD